MTDAGLAHFQDCKKLRNLGLAGTGVTEAGLAHFQDCKKLRNLGLANTGLNDDGLAKLPKLSAPQRLVLDGNNIRGHCLPYLKEQPVLIDLSLACPVFTDFFATDLAELKGLQRLSLAGSGITDAGLKHVAALVNLKELDLRGTKITGQGIASLQKSLPKCKILWEGK